MSRLAVVSWAVALLGGCETGYALKGNVVPDGAVDRDRQLLIFVSEEVDRNLDLPLVSAPDLPLTKAVERIEGDSVPFTYGTLGCPKEVQVIVVAPKTRVALPDLSEANSRPIAPVKVSAGDYVAKTALLSTSEGCGAGSQIQRITVTLSAEEWGDP